MKQTCLPCIDRKFLIGFIVCQQLMCMLVFIWMSDKTSQWTEKYTSVIGLYSQHGRYSVNKDAGILRYNGGSNKLHFVQVATASARYNAVQEQYKVTRKTNDRFTPFVGASRRGPSSPIYRPSRPITGPSIPISQPSRPIAWTSTPITRPTGNYRQQVLSSKVKHDVQIKGKINGAERHLYLQDDPKVYFHNISGQSCLIVGATNTTNGCTCAPNWHGPYCSFPTAMPVITIQPRLKARRVINGITFNVEFEQLEARLDELHSVVDAFLIVESNFSNYGEPKERRLLNRLKTGYLKKYHHQIVYISLDHFPNNGRKDGWIVDDYTKNFMGLNGLKYLKNKKPDDLFVMNDADEIPSRNTIFFLKTHDGYPEPVGVHLRWSVYGFYWRMKQATTNVLAVCSLKMLEYVFNNEPHNMRAQHHIKYPDARKKYLKYHQQHNVKTSTADWYITGLAGWHCSWCFDIERIRIKLVSAINADFPRWGDYPEKQKHSYIKKLIINGMWFDDTQMPVILATPSTDNLFAPSYFLRQPTRFSYLLRPVGTTVSSS